MTLTPNRRGAALMTAAMAGFTLSDACMKALGAEWPLFQSLFLRGCGTTALLTLMAWRMGQLRRPAMRDLRLVGVRSLCEIAASWFYLTAVLLLPLANVAAIHQAVPLTVTLAGMLVLGERVRPAALLAVLAGFGGVLLIIRPGAEGFTPATLLVLGSVAAVTVRDLVSRTISPAVPSLLVAAVGALGVTVFSAVGAAFVDWQPLSGPAALALGGTMLGVLGGYVASVGAMRVGEIAAVTPFRYTALLMAIALGALMFGTLPDAPTLAGAAVVVAAGAWTLMRGGGARLRPEEEASPGA
ncbi:DMT family transporter [Rubellimicrobium roseum]|uniref:DMT family transporter n=1 Tax=Rubellimicrobium roseum TaxID=687525 RepID=A0A5C4N4D0_9RHOB|nr:DMT family transporter [Rubellimicrobium roseum]TNC62291.1 DMT family transporter [Rubellimicrobium roseum]